MDIRHKYKVVYFINQIFGGNFSVKGWCLVGLMYKYIKNFENIFVGYI